MPVTHHLDLNRPGFIADPYPELAQLREHMPVFYDQEWNRIFFTRYRDIAALLKDKRLGRGILHILSREEIGWPPPDPRLQNFYRYEDNVFMDREPATHTRIRSLVTQVFTPRRVEGLRPSLEATAHRLIDAVDGQSGFDFVSGIAEPLPVIMIAGLLGIPETDRHLLRPWSAAIVRMYELGCSRAEMQAADRAAREFMDYIGSLAAERRLHPRADLISGLVQAGENGQGLTEHELRATCIFLLNAGHEATVNGSSLGLLALLRNPAQMDLLRSAAAGDHTALIKTAVDELLRYDSPLPLFERWVLEDMDFHGLQLRRGVEVALLYASGNRDPAQFEHADDLDLTRRDNPLLTFGLGTHYCLGAPLARLELQVLFKILLQRLPVLELAGEPEYNRGFVIRGLKRLPILS
jgi:cytochrome P450